jgi:hypothetical protein
MALVCILWTIQSRCGWLQLYKDGALSEFSVMFTNFYLNQATGRCDAKPNNLDVSNSYLQNCKKTEFLIKNWDMGTLWTNFGVCADIVVSVHITIAHNMFLTVNI